MSIITMRTLACTLRLVEDRDKPDSQVQRDAIVPLSLPAASIPTLAPAPTRLRLVGMDHLEMDLPGMGLQDGEARPRRTCHRQSR